MLRMMLAMALAAGLSGCVVVAEREVPVAPPAPEASRVHVIPRGLERSYQDYHYTPALRVGDQVIVSGIPAMQGDSYEAKVRWMFEQLRQHLADAGAGMQDVVELTSFHAGATDSASFQAEFARFAPIHAEFFPDHYPAWSAVGVSALLATGAPVELRAVAVVGSGRRPALRRVQVTADTP